MKLFIDINHPATAHSLHYFICEMKSRGYDFLITARDKDLTQPLLNKWDFKFINRAKGAKSLLGKILDLFIYLINLYKITVKYKPDVFISFNSYHSSILGKLIGKPVITLEDSENVGLLHLINRFFSSYMVTPECFEQDFGRKHIKFSGYKELMTLHPMRFTPDVNKQPLKPYIVLRFVSWEAWHDRGHKGIKEEMKDLLIQELSKYVKIYISTEYELPRKWEKYKLPVSFEDIHSLVAGASLFLGESASMSAEAAVLGIPAIYINNNKLGYINELSKYGLLFKYGETDKEVLNSLSKAIELLNDDETHSQYQQKRKQMLSEKIDVTDWLVKFVEKIYEEKSAKKIM